MSLELALQQIVFARGYTQTLLTDIPDELWYEQPRGSASNIAWQVAHLAFAEYALALMRVRGKEPGDQEFISNDFFKRFKKGSVPPTKDDREFTLDDIRKTFDHVHEQTLQEIPKYSEELLAEALPAPYVAQPNKLGSLLFCAAHEMLHAGQIGLIRRQFGKEPIR
jgi:uncharacterized damage-inducible protein DinB